MKYIAAIDISTLIWSKHEFNANPNQYYKFVSLAPTVYRNIKKLRIPLLFRNELYELVNAEFPHLEINNIDYKYGVRTLQFLIDSDWVLYDEAIKNGFNAIPILIKDFFVEGIKNEVNNQVVHLHKENTIHKFITYKPFYASDCNLAITNNQNVTFEVDTLNYNEEEEIVAFFEKYKLKFEHHPKHRAEQYYDYERDEDVAPFSCFHKQGQARAQKLLEDAFLFESNYYHFDLENQVFIRFIKTRELIYHGHDLVNEGNNIPNKVKKHFSK